MRRMRAAWASAYWRHSGIHRLAGRPVRPRCRLAGSRGSRAGVAGLVWNRRRSLTALGERLRAATLRRAGRHAAHCCLRTRRACRSRRCTSIVEPPQPPRPARRHLWIGGGQRRSPPANQVFAWLSGLPLRTRAGARGLEHEPLLNGAGTLLADGAVDAVLWVSSFVADALPPTAAQALPTVVLGLASAGRSLPARRCRVHSGQHAGHRQRWPCLPHRRHGADALACRARRRPARRRRRGGDTARSGEG